MASGKVTSISSKCEFKWEIDNFQKSSSNNVGDYLESPKYTAYCASGKVQWYLRLYPNGDAKDAKNHLSLFVYANPAMVGASHLKIITNTGKVMSNRITQKDVFNNNGFGYSTFVSRDFILNPANGILKDNKLIVLCEITMFYPYQEVQPVQRIGATKRKFDEITDTSLQRLKVLDEYETLFINSKFTDVSLISQGKMVKAHKCILAKSSSVFAAIFDTAESKNIVNVDDIRPGVLIQMIRFIYTGKVDNIAEIASELAFAADKYALDGLQDTCEKSMMEDLSLDNVVNRLQFADKLRMDKLKEKSIEFVVENAADITDKAEFELLAPDILRKVCRGLAKKSQ